MVYLSPEKQLIYDYFLSHYNKTLTKDNPMNIRLEVLSHHVIENKYIYYVIRDKQEHEIYDVLYDARKGLMSLDVMSNDD